MITKETISVLRQLIGDGQLEQAFGVLEKVMGDLPDDFLLIKAQYEDSRNRFGAHVINDDTYQIDVSRCRYSFLESLKPYEQQYEKKEQTFKFNPKYQFTCDRSKQYNIFEPLLDEAACARIHYFYLHGGESHKHESLFRRFVNRTIGEERSTGYTVVDISINDIGPDTDLNRLGLEFSKAILRELGNPECNWPKIPERSLAWAIANGERTSQLHEKGKILLHLGITDGIWDAEIVPAQAFTLIQNFCEKTPLPADAPEVFFFFSIEYDNNNQDIKKDIDNAMAQAKYLNTMGELQMVTQIDIKNWFLKYRKIWDDEDEREAVREKYFGAETGTMYMKKVQRALKSIIDEINESNKYAKRQ